jgi:hypothetical protein
LSLVDFSFPGGCVCVYVLYVSCVSYDEGRLSCVGTSDFNDKSGVVYSTDIIRK